MDLEELINCVINMVRERADKDETISLLETILENVKELEL